MMAPDRRVLVPHAVLLLSKYFASIVIMCNDYEHHNFIKEIYTALDKDNENPRKITILVIRNSANMGFSQLIWEYKQNFYCHSFMVCYRDQ